MKIKVKFKRIHLYNYSMIVKHYYDKIRNSANYGLQDYADHYNLKYLILKLLNKIHVTSGQKISKEVSITIDINEAETLIRLSTQKNADFGMYEQNILLKLCAELSTKINEQHWAEHYRQLESKPTYPVRIDG